MCRQSWASPVKKMVDINPNSPQLIHSSTLIGCDAPMTSPQDPLVLLIMVSIIFHSSGVTWHTNTPHETTATVRSVDHTSTSSGTAGTCSAGFCGSVLWVNVSHPPQLVELSCHRHVFSSVQTDHLKTKSHNQTDPGSGSGLSRKTQHKLTAPDIQVA